MHSTGQHLKNQWSLTPLILRAGEKFVFLIAMLILTSVIVLHRQSLMPLLYPVIEDLQLQGQFVHIERLHIDRLAQNSIGKYFFNIDLYTVKEAIEALPWVKYARVTRIWPQTLNITIEEHQAEARWGENSLISSEAVIFSPANAGKQRLPILYAREGMESLTLARYRQARKLLADVGAIGIEALGEDYSGAWGVLLDNGVFVKIGDVDWERRLQRFVAVWQSVLHKESERIRHVDLRYPDGFAIAWKS